MADTAGQIVTPTVQETVDQYLRDLRLAALDSGFDEPPVTPGTDNWIHAKATSEAAGVGIANVAIAEANSNELTATGEALEEKREALGLPIIVAVGSSGRVVPDINGTTTIVDGEVLILPNGLRIEVVGTYINPSSGAEIDVRAIDVGVDTNFPGGTEVRFLDAPANVGEVALVSVGQPLKGGTADEDPARLRDRIANVRKNRPAGGNWSDYSRTALDATGAVDGAFVYPALGGPSTVKLSVTSPMDPDNLTFTRAPTSTTVNTVRGNIFAEFPDAVDNVVQGAADEKVDVALGVTIPNSTLTGGDGTGWVNQQIWPTLEVADSGRVTVTSNVGKVLTVTANTAVSPTALNTRIAWWSRNTMQFHSALVESSTGSAGAWVLTLTKPLVDTTGATPQVGDFISPDAVNLANYATTWIDILGELGTGEMVGSGDSRFSRSKRHPTVDNTEPANIDQPFLDRFARANSEVSIVASQYQSATSPSLPASIQDPANIFSPRQFAIYPN